MVLWSSGGPLVPDAAGSEDSLTMDTACGICSMCSIRILIVSCYLRSNNLGELPIDCKFKCRVGLGT